MLPQRDSIAGVGLGGQRGVSSQTPPAEVPFKPSVSCSFKRKDWKFGEMFDFLIKHLTDQLNCEACLNKNESL